MMGKYHDELKEIISKHMNEGMREVFKIAEFDMALIINGHCDSVCTAKSEQNCQWCREGDMTVFKWRGNE